MFKFFNLLLSIFIIFNGSRCNAISVIDDLGNTVQLIHPANRIVSLAPDLTEILFASGAGKKIIGVMQGCDYPLEATKIPVIAWMSSINPETLISLHPDLIVIWAGGTNKQTLKQLQQLGIPIYFSNQKKISDIPNTILRFGLLAGTEKTANEYAKLFLKHFQQLQRQYSQQTKISVFYQVWSKPLMTISQHSWINEVISLCGGKNIFEDLPGIASEINIETLIMRKPQVIFANNNFLQRWPQISAIHEGHLYSFHADWIERAGPRILQGADEICHDLELVRLKN